MQQHNQQQRNKMSLIIVSLLSLLISISAFSARVESKPINQNQVKFRRLPPKEFSAALGSSITIECEAGGSPPPAIHWLKNGNRILQNDLDENQLEDGQPIQVDDVNRIALSATRSRLFIDCASFDDEAVYTCVAENAFSRISSHTKLNLIRPQPALAAVASENDLLSEEVAALELAAVAASGSSGDIKQLAAAGADIDASEKSSLSAVPQCLSQRGVRSSEPPRIHMWTHNIVEVMKNNVILYCRSNIKRQLVSQQQSQQTAAESSSAQKTTTTLMTTTTKSSSAAATTTKQQDNDTGSNGKKSYVSWTLPDDKLVSAEQKHKYEIMDTGDLLIKDLSWSDMGSYVCTVSDDQGSDSVSAFVYPAAVKTTATHKRAIAHTTRLADFR